MLTGPVLSGEMAPLPSKLRRVDGMGLDDGMGFRYIAAPLCDREDGKAGKRESVLGRLNLCSVLVNSRQSLL